MTDQRKPPLDGIKVLDLSRYVAGPMCAMMLADLGAEVIKVEGPGGEDNRHMEPRSGGWSIQTMAYNRNKRAFTTEMRTPEGRAELLDLANWADVVIENFRPGVLEKIGLDYDSLSKTNPRVIVTSVSGFGQYGPLKDRPLFDPIAQAMSGMMMQNAMPDNSPKLTGAFFGDHSAALYAALATMAALIERQSSGRGQAIDISVFDSMLSLLGPGLATYSLTGEPLPNTQNRDPFSSPATVFTARDGSIYVHAGTQGLFRRLCEMMGDGSIAEDPRFATIAARQQNIDAVESLVEEWIGSQSVAEVEHKLASAGIPCAVVATVSMVHEDPQVAAREMLVRAEDSAGTPVAFLGNPIKLSATPVRYILPPPLVGEHNDEVHALIDDLRAHASN
jgi:crotonobetainyl-CoA:carnitine CoA-transferase CaiB-like acyl-CoA transferase